MNADQPPTTSDPAPLAAKDPDDWVTGIPVIALTVQEDLQVAAETRSVLPQATG
jgi:hypothetical protein